MPRYEIKKDKWLEANNGTVVGPVLAVGLEGSELPATWFGLHCDSHELRQLEEKLPQQQRECWVQRLHGAFRRFAIQLLENALKQEAAIPQAE